MSNENHFPDTNREHEELTIEPMTELDAIRERLKAYRESFDPPEVQHRADLATLLAHIDKLEADKSRMCDSIHFWKAENERLWKALRACEQQSYGDEGVIPEIVSDALRKDGEG